jgi:hypothetical protein
MQAARLTYPSHSNPLSIATDATVRRGTAKANSILLKKAHQYRKDVQRLRSRTFDDLSNHITLSTLPRHFLSSTSV